MTGFHARLVYDPPGHLSEVQTGDCFRRAERDWTAVPDTFGEVFESPDGGRFMFTAHKAISGDGGPSVYEGWMAPVETADTTGET